ncbi:MAG TPA: DNA topoisomerase, partial [Roseiflexaceae bacterium]|nr:DNA topoisomerase [Roseiflexaceae bacterium]
EAVRNRLTGEQFRLYDLIWKRFIASQMAAAIFDSTTVDIAAGRELAGGAPAKQVQSFMANPAYVFRATGSVLKFPGFLAVYNVSLDEGEEDEDSERRLPLLQENEDLDLAQLLPIQHFTEPPPRFTEASLVKELERLGIGRPSTYAPTISTVIEREYIELSDKKLLPTALGRVVTDLLVEHFAGIVDYSFTSEMEQQLDDIAEGSKKWVPVLRSFYGPFERTLEHAQQSMRNVKREEILTNLTCPTCGEGQLAIKFGRNGEFLACNRYPDCQFTSDFHRTSEGAITLDAPAVPEYSDVMCNLCGKPMIVKKSRFGPFLGCSGYPECTNTRRIGRDGKPVPLPEPTGVACPQCGEGEILQRRGKFGRPFFGCNRYPKCDYIVNELADAIAGKPSTATSKPVQSKTPPKAAASGARSTRAKSSSSTSTRAKNGTTTARSTSTRAKSGTATAKSGTRKTGTRQSSAVKKKAS